VAERSARSQVSPETDAADIAAFVPHPSRLHASLNGMRTEIDHILHPPAKPQRPRSIPLPYLSQHLKTTSTPSPRHGLPPSPPLLYSPTKHPHASYGRKLVTA
jgi:hypothetical protein